MIPKPDNRERLLAETYHGDWSSGNAAHFAARAATAARRHRALRLALKGTAVATLLLAATVAITSQRAPATIAHTTLPAYEIISDAELLALVQDRPLLLIQTDDTPGSSQQIVTFTN